MNMGFEGSAHAEREWEVRETGTEDRRQMCVSGERRRARGRVALPGHSCGHGRVFLSPGRAAPSVPLSSSQSLVCPSLSCTLDDGPARSRRGDGGLHTCGPGPCGQARAAAIDERPSACPDRWPVRKKRRGGARCGSGAHAALRAPHQPIARRAHKPPGAASAYRAGARTEERAAHAVMPVSTSHSLPQTLPQPSRAAALTPPAASADPAVTATKWWDAHPALPNLRTVEGLDTLLGELQAAGDALVIVDVYGTWCGACRAVFPKFVKLAEAHPDVVFLKLPFDENKAIAKALGAGAGGGAALPPWVASGLLPPSSLPSCPTPHPLSSLTPHLPHLSLTPPSPARCQGPPRLLRLPGQRRPPGVLHRRPLQGRRAGGGRRAPQLAPLPAGRAGRVARPDGTGRPAAGGGGGRPGGRVGRGRRLKEAGERVDIISRCPFQELSCCLVSVCVCVRACVHVWGIPLPRCVCIFRPFFSTARGAG